jgi:general secretion pathway protein B
MSYILDALKKAEAERERGQVPGLNAATPASRPDELSEGQHLPSWVWALLGALMMLIAALVWSLTGRDDAPTPNQAQEATAARPASPATTPGPLAAPPPTTHLPEQTQAPAFEPEASLPAVPMPAPARRARQIPAPTPAPAEPNTSADQRVYTISELPEDIRQALPSLQFGGAMYSDQPSSRMLIINSKAFHEGDHVMADLVLREIRLRSAVLVYRGHAYSVSY